MSTRDPEAVAALEQIRQFIKEMPAEERAAYHEARKAIRAVVVVHEGAATLAIMVMAAELSAAPQEGE